MDLHSLLSVLLHKDCITEAQAELERLTTLATANGGNDTLHLYLTYINKFKTSPNAEQVKILASTTEKISEAALTQDLENAASWHALYPENSFGLAMSESWRHGSEDYVNAGYKSAMLVAMGSSLGKEHQWDRWKKKRFGDGEYNAAQASQIWLQEYLAANPFAAKMSDLVLGDGESVVSTHTKLDGDEMVTSRMTVIEGNAVKPVAIDWWWEERFALGKIAWLAGLPGAGKTMVMLDTAARISRGTDFPDKTKNKLGPRRVLIAMSEDGIEDTIVPRLIAAGADMNFITFLDRVVSDVEDRTPNLEDDLGHLRNALTKYTDAALLIMDPMTAYFGSDVNINVDKEVRPIMTGLKKLCEEFKIGFMGVIHNNKQNDANSIQRILGASSVVGAARSVYGCSTDPDDKTKRYFSWIKGNCSAQTKGIEYTVTTVVIDGGIKAPIVVWGDETDETAETILKRERDSKYERKDNKQINLAEGLVPMFLKGKGAVFSTDLYAAAEAEGISIHAVKRAISTTFSNDVLTAKDGKTGKWTVRWKTPEQTLVDVQDVI